MGYSIYKIFSDLKCSESANESCFSTSPIPFSKKHKIGISHEGYPMFFIECNSNAHSLDINLEFISVLFNRPCLLSDENITQYENIYTIIQLKTNNISFQQYFLEVVCIVLELLPETPSHEQLKTEIQKLVELFSRFTRPPRKTIQGLWGELLIIEQAKDPEYLIQSWHVSPDNKFDFNDGQDKIEVKSVSQTRRIHNFSLEQLCPNKNSNLIIASVVVEIGRASCRERV